MERVLAHELRRLIDTEEPVENVRIAA